MPADTLHDAFGRTARQGSQVVQGPGDSALRHQRKPLAAALDFVAEDSCGPLYRRQQLGLSDPVRGRRETAGGGLDQDQGAAGTGGISGLTGRPQVVRRLRNRFPTVVNQR